MNTKGEKISEEPSTAEDKRKHLEFIQGIISRMGGNLFYLRGWSITLIGGLLALLSQQNKTDKFPLFMLTGIIVVFWFYDGYFLTLERCYRSLYNKVRQQSIKDVDYSMDIREFSADKKNTLIYCMFSKTLAPFYLLFLIAAIYLIIRSF
jgi:hypothetical protein